MMDAVTQRIAQRLRSKTYWAAVLGLALTALEANTGLLTAALPSDLRGYAVLLWPVLMLTLREVTTSALADK